MNEFDNIKSAILPYNQVEIEETMKQIMYANGMTDVVYEGSNISQLTSIVSYVIATLNANTAMNLQETILPLATKRMNILFGARQLGYEPHAIKSYKYQLILKPVYDTSKTIIDPNTGEEIIDVNNTEDRKISLVHNTQFKSGENYYYYVGPTLVDVITVNNYDITHYNDESTGRPKEDITLEVPVVEGVLTTPLDDEMLRMVAQDYSDNGEVKTKQDYMIGYTDVEEDYGLQVYINYIDDDGFYVMNEEWKKSNQFLIDETLEYNKRKFVRKENIILGYPVIFFQFAGLGEGIRTGTQIEVNVLQSSGPAGEALEAFEVTDTSFSEQMEVIEYHLLEEGRTSETDQEIKDNAIVFKNTANRAVTRYDYITIAKRHDLINEADAWGGEDEDPKVKGNIWLSCTPSNPQRAIITVDDGYKIDIGTPSHEPTSEVQKNWNNWYVSDDNYSELFTYLDAYKIMTMDLNYRHPLYINFDYVIDVVKYDISKDPKTTNAVIFAAINDFFINRVEKFEAEYLNSNVQRILDTVLDYNTGVNFELELSGTLCEDMIDKYRKEVYNKEEILVALSWPFENIFTPDGTDVDTSKLPRIDGPFGQVENGYITVNYEDLQKDPDPDIVTLWTRVTDIIYSIPKDPEDPENTETIDRKVGEYKINLDKMTINLKFIIDEEVKIEEIFGEVNDEGFREYTEFSINYYPFDKNLVNLAFSSHRIPRLRNVKFTSI